MNKRKLAKRGIYFVSGILLLAQATEGFLRGYFGFCDTVLIQSNPRYEYIPQPGQERFRFRNHIYYNSYSMRSREPDTTQMVILGFGDSVLNGGVLTDQDSLATSLLSTELSELYGQQVQFLNVSAGSWGPDNCFAYLQQHGNFGAKKIYLIVSSHDAFDTMDFQPVVGIDKSFPDRQYASALLELWDRYLLPRLGFSARDSNILGINKKMDSSAFNPGFQRFVEYSSKHDLPLVVYLHAEQSELVTGAYNAQGEAILDYMEQNKIPVISDLDSGLNARHFRDNIHYNAAGQRLLAALIFNHEKQGFLD